MAEAGDSPASPAHGRDKQLDMVIVGGSLGGLCTALALKSLPQRHRITILERNPTPLLHNQGAGIVAGGDTLRFFKRYDRCHRPLAVSSQRRQHLDKRSTIRSILQHAQRTYAGYVALRGTVREAKVTPKTIEAFQNHFIFFHTHGIQILAYLIPGENGTLEPGQRLINFVYYTNFPAKSLDEHSEELAELMTDVDSAAQDHDATGEDRPEGRGEAARDRSGEATATVR